jgi:hypothetical protein
LVIAALGSFLCGAGLCVPAFIAGNAGPGGLFLAAPADLHAPEIDVQKIEPFSDENFPLTYEITEPEKAVVLGLEYPVTFIGTNSRYPRLLGYSIVEGSFFSKEDWEGGRRHAVLNGKAAFALFGTGRAAGGRLKIRGETWIVAGVINDGDEDNSRIYAPSSVRGGRASYLLAQTDSAGGIDASYIRDSLKSLGVYDGGFDFFDLGAELRFFWERAAVSLMLLGCLFLAFLIPPALGKFRGLLFLLRQELKKRYPLELLRTGSGIVLMSFAAALVLPACAGGILFLLLRIASICLPWQDLPSPGSLDRRNFYPSLALLQDCAAASGILFWLFLASLAAVFVFKVKSHSQNPAGFGNSIFEKKIVKNAKKMYPFKKSCVTIIGKFFNFPCKGKNL